MPYSIIQDEYDKIPKLFKDNPYLKLVGLNIYHPLKLLIQFWF